MFFELILFLMLGAVCGTHWLYQVECSSHVFTEHCARERSYEYDRRERVLYKRQKDPDHTYGPCV